MKITQKDWDRMLDLYLSNDSGESVAEKIKKADKAAVRFVCGAKLSGITAEYMEGHRYIQFRPFYEKAIELGVSRETILSLIDSTEIPESVSQKVSELSSKKYGNRFVGTISKFLIKAGYNINYLNRGGDALTLQGRDAMNRNGRKWTIGYISEIIINGEAFPFVFDAITDEGGGPTYYAVSDSKSHTIFNTYFGDPIGQRAFLNFIEKRITEYLNK